MLGNKISKSSKSLGIKGLTNPQLLGIKYNKPSNNPHTLTTGLTGLSNNEHTQQSIYVPVGLKQPKEYNSKKYNSLETFKKNKKYYKN